MECGVHAGGGLLSWGQLSAIYEPNNFTRRIIGFDTFEGFPGVSEKDISTFEPDERCKKGGLASQSYEDLCKAIELFDQNRFIGHVEKIKLVKGDACQTIPKYIESNAHTVVSLLYLDFDLYEPTKVALEHILPRMPKGSIVAFDELNTPNWPGETLAVQEIMGINNIKIQRFPFDSQCSYAVIE